ncbi:MAG: 50S ribosomal protein L20 [Patescibacteria group bacterium]
MRVKRGATSHKRHKKILRKARGFKYGRSRKIKRAHEALQKSGQNSYRSRRVRKRDFRTLWITRLSAALKTHDIKYSRFIDALTKKGVILDRKVLSNLAIEDPAIFSKVVELAKK